jgi:hypothetical protein
MTQLRKCFCSMVWVLFLTVLCTSASGQAVPVYVSGGSNIYKISGGTASLVLAVSGANFESLAIGPDNADTDLSGNATHPFLLYACDTANNKIYRFGFDPTGTTITTTDTVYSNGVTGLQPVCGRSSSTGDFYITNKAGAGVYRFSNLANVKAGQLAPASPTILQTSPAFPAAMDGRGITQKYDGDLLVVDNTENQVLLSPFVGNFSTRSNFIPNPSAPSALLSSPVGISRISTGEVFVANSVLASGKTTFSPVVHFNRDGSAASTCSGLNFSKKTNEVPAYLATVPLANSTQAAVTDTVYLVTASKSGGTLWTWNTAIGNCSLSALASIQNPLSGVAVAPAPVTLSLQVTTLDPTNPTPTVFDFHSNQFWLTGADGCKANVTATPLIPATVTAMISLAQGGTAPFPHGAGPSPDLGGAGYETVYVAHWLAPALAPAPGCMSVFTDHGFETSIFGFYDTNQYNNPRMVQCDNGDPKIFPQSTEPHIDGTAAGNAATTCFAPQSEGVYPILGPIPGDQGLTSKNSFFATVNAGLTAAEPGKFCGFQSPLTGDGTNLPSPPAVFTGNTIAVKFKLATNSGSCQNGPYISDASALISVARLADSSGPFSAIRVNATASSLDTPPLFNAGNNQYSFSLNTGGYAPGTYSLTVTFLSDNTVNQTTLFKIP